MTPIADAIQLKSYEALSLEILKRQMRRATDLDPILDDEIKQLYEVRKLYKPDTELMNDRARKLFRIIETELPSGIECTLIFHRIGGNNFISFTTSSAQIELIAILEEISTQLRNKL